QLTEKRGSAHYGNSFFYGFFIFFICIKIDGSSINYQIDAGGNIIRRLLVTDMSAFFFQVICNLIMFYVRTVNCKTFFEEDFSEYAHADASDSHKMNMNWMMKIYLIHEL